MRTVFQPCKIAQKPLRHSGAAIGVPDATYKVVMGKSGGLRRLELVLTRFIESGVLMGAETPARATEVPNTMAKVDYIKPIDALHGKIQKEDQVGYARKQLENAKGVRTRFTQTYGKRTTAYSQAELDHQNYFGIICAAVAARRKDSAQKVTDMANFRAQSQYTTITQYLWHICKAEYDALHPGN